MRRIKTLACLLAVVFATFMLVGCDNTTQQRIDKLNASIKEKDEQITQMTAQLEKEIEPATEFEEWFYRQTWRTVANGNWSEEAADKPSNEQINKMFAFASHMATSGGKGDYLLVALTDYEQQVEALGQSETAKRVTEGTVTILIFGDRIFSNEYKTTFAASNEDFVKGGSFAPDRGYYDTGLISGYLNAIAVTMGFGTHLYMTPTTSAGSGEAGTGMSADSGQYDADKKGYDADKWLQGLTYKSAGTEYPAIGNLKFVCAMVVGKIADGTSIEAGSTTHEYPNNGIIYTAPQGGEGDGGTNP